MKTKVFLVSALLFLSAATAGAQNVQTEKPPATQNYSAPINPLDNISLEISKISKSVQTFNKRLRACLKSTPSVWLK